MKTPDKSHPVWPRVVLVTWILLCAGALAFLPVGMWLKQISAFVLSLGWIAPFAYIAVYVVFCVFLIPVVTLSVGVGPVFGFVNGLLLTVIASNLGASVAFMLGRTVFRARVERWAADKPRFKAIDTAIERNALSVVALLRLAPIFPFTIFNYIFPLTRVKYRTFALGTFLGMLPLNVAFLYVSCEAARALDDATQKEVNTLRLGLRIGGIVMTVAALALISRIAVKAVKDVEADVTSPKECVTEAIPG